ncbi:MAG: hypothetical protein IPL46_06855 [Saprospiraceae bacterium]|nr:hypothetical protein [Saprospiraceae bacterium]
MKKILIGALVGGIILFLWQFLSWTMLGIHTSGMAYIPSQDAILECLSANISEDGFYFLPTAAPGTSSADAQAIMEQSVGKPWAQVFYHKAMNYNMGMNMFRALVADILAGFLLCWVLLKFAHLDLKTCVLASLAIGLTGYLSISYLNGVWFELKTMPDLIDVLVSWSLVGVWLGWWLNK